MAAYFEIDDVIDPADSRRWIATLFDQPPRRPSPSAAPTSTPGDPPAPSLALSQAPRSTTS